MGPTTPARQSQYLMVYGCRRLPSVQGTDQPRRGMERPDNFEGWPRFEHILLSGQGQTVGVLLLHDSVDLPCWRVIFVTTAARFKLSTPLPATLHVPYSLSFDR